MNADLVSLQPAFTFALQFAAAVALTLAVPLVNTLLDKISTKLGLQANATAHATIDGVVEDAIHYAQTYAVQALTKVGPIDIGNPQVAAAANFVIGHAPEELAQLGFTEQHVIDLVRSALQQTTEKSA
jgi:hypothetical protein